MQTDAKDLLVEEGVNSLDGIINAKMLNVINALGESMDEKIRPPFYDCRREWFRDANRFYLGGLDTNSTHSTKQSRETHQFFVWIKKLNLFRHAKDVKVRPIHEI